MRKVCTNCERDFECLESTECWCNKLDATHEPSENLDCLCKECLSMESKWIGVRKPRTYDSNIGCKKHRWIVGVMDREENLILFECTICHMQHEIHDVFD
jgi:hypothetical protein